MSRYPFPTTPNGWYQVAYADELKVGAVVPLRYFGGELVAWRDEAGMPHVFDAHCPHLGAHLAYGGHVDAGCLRCPFHGWRFDVRGQCASIPGDVKIPPRARVRSWRVDEANGMVFVFADATGREPTWHVPAIPELGDGTFHPIVRREWTIHAHVQELVENAVDGPHFAEVHRVPTMPRTTVETDGPQLRSMMYMQQRTPRGTRDTSVETTAFGIGLMTLRFRGICETVLVTTQTPVDDDRFHLRFSIAVTRDGGVTPERGVGAAIVADIVRQLDQDIPIWEHKVYPEPSALGALGVCRA